MCLFIGMFCINQLYEISKDYPNELKLAGSLKRSFANAVWIYP